MMLFWRNAVPVLLTVAAIACLWHQNALQPTALAQLAGPWEYCHTDAGFDTVGCAWRPIQLPAELPFAEASRFTGYLVYRTSFDMPAACSVTDCAFVAGEIGDATEVLLNGRRLGRFGRFPPRAQYYKNFPINAAIPTELGTNAARTIELRVFSYKVPQTGPRQGPLLITTAAEARFFSYVKVARNVFVPLASAAAIVLVCFLTNLFPLRTIRDLKLMPAFVAFCVVSCLFLVSFSEVPRQYIPVVAAVPLHFVLRYGSDWVFFHLLCLFFGFRGALSRTFHGMFAVAVGTELLLMLAGISLLADVRVYSSVDVLTWTYRTVYVFGFLLLVAPLAGALASARAKSTWRVTLVVAFLAIMAGQGFDYLVYAGVLQGDYISKFHHLVVAFFFSGLMIRRAAAMQMASILSEKTSMMRDAEISAGRLALQVAHDIRSPLAALTMMREDLGKLPEDSRLLMRAAVERIEDICNSLRGRHGHHLEEATGGSMGDAAMAVDVADALPLLIAERRLAWQASSPVVLRYCPDAHAYGAFAQVRPSDLAVLLANILNNAAEACDGAGEVVVELAVKKSCVVVRITDTGHGMDADELAMLGAHGYTAGKASGSGLGVHHAKSALQRWGGDLTYESRKGEGTTATVTLPQCAAPVWFVPEIQLPLHGAIVILDDDSSIHEIWKRRFAQVRSQIGNVDVWHFFSASELTAYVHGGGLATLYLLDHELVGEAKTGLDLAHELGICANSILVTSHAGERPLQATCGEFGMRLLSKALAMQVPIRISRPNRLQRHDAEAWL